MRIAGSALLVLVPLRLGAGAQAAGATPGPSPSPSVLSPTAQGYADFALGKWAELEAESRGGQNYIQEALRDYRAALQAEPNSAYIASQLADLLSRLGETQQATELAQSVTTKHPDSLVAHQTLGTIYLRELSRQPQPITGKVMDAARAEYKALLRLDPGNINNRVTLGKLYGASGQPALAEQEFREALAVAPTNVDALASLIQSLAGQGQLSEAQKVVDSLPAVAQSGQVYAILGDAYVNQHLYMQAAAAFQQAVAAEPDQPSFQNDLAQAWMNAGKFSEAVTAYARLRQENPADGRAALRLGQAQMQMGQLDAARASLNDAAKLLPANDLEVSYAQALLDEAQGRLPDALTKLRALVARKASANTRSIFLEQLSGLEMRTGDEAGALNSLHEMEKLGGSHAVRAHALEVELYSRQRDFAKALEAARIALADQPKSRSLQITYANLLAASGQSKAATAALQPLLQGTQADWELYLALGRIELEARQWKLAQTDAGQADRLAATPAEHARAAALQGDIDAKQQQYAQAEKSYQRALALRPNDPATLNAYGYLLANRGVRLTQALDLLQKAVTHDSTNGAYLDSLGWVYFKMNRLPDAVATLERAANLDRHDPNVLDHLAQAYDRDGKLTQAEASWRQALADLKLNPGDHDRQTAQIEKRLQAVRVRIAQAAKQ